MTGSTYQYCTIAYEPEFLLLTHQYVFSLMNKYIGISTTGAYCRYWRDFARNYALADKFPRYVSLFSIDLLRFPLVYSTPPPPS